jgi:hypothetical protein
MIRAYTGTPGSGKTLDVMRAICHALRANKKVLCNIRLRELPDNLEKKRHLIEYLKDSDITPRNLLRYAVLQHDLSDQGKEYQTLVVIDECQLIFSDTVMKKWQERQWLRFFSQHRKLRYNFLLITQDLRGGMVRQIRDKVEHEILHWKLSNMPTKSIIFGIILLMIQLLPFDVFISIEKWGASSERVKRLFLYKPKLGNMYGTYELFDMEELKEIIGEEEELENDYIFPEINLVLPIEEGAAS